MIIDFDILKKYSDSDEGLRDYQQDNKKKVYDAWEHINSVMLQMPTGTGKTRLFVSIIKDIFHYSRDTKVALRVLVLVHRTELIDQIDEELGFRYNLAHGIIQSGERERKIYPIQLASVQTLSRRLDNWTDKEFDFIIVDEAHHVKADSYQKIIRAFPHAKLLGVTATPVRLNGHGFTDTFEELIVSPSVRQFIDDGYLSQYEYYSVARSSFIQQEIDGIKKFSQGDYAESELERVCDNDRIRAQVVKTYLDFAKGKKGIVYTINKLHNRNLCEEFNENGVSAVAIDSDTPKDVREQYIKQFRRGEFNIICNVNLFTEGFDCPDIEFIQLARPTKSLALYLQQVGRGLRFSESKEKTLFLDNVGLYNRFGFPSSRRMWKHHFEGKYDGNKTEEEVEGKKDVTKQVTEKRNRNQNLEEGHEQVHLIQTTEEREYLRQRVEQFKNWLSNIHQHHESAYLKAYKRKHIDGLKLIVERKQLFHMYSISMISSTKSLEDAFKTEKFFFFKYVDGKFTDEKYRLCKNYDEFLDKTSSSMYSLKSDLFLNDFKAALDIFKNLHYSKSELEDIVTTLYEEKWKLPYSNCETEEEVIFIGEILELFWECSINNRGKKIMTSLVESISTLVRNIINNDKE